MLGNPILLQTFLSIDTVLTLRANSQHATESGTQSNAEERAHSPKELQDFAKLVA